MPVVQHGTLWKDVPANSHGKSREVIPLMTKQRKVMPQRSKGCALCRQRKIRCDGARPGCRRCHVFGKPCPGYNAGTWQFHDQSKQISERFGSQLPTDFALENNASPPQDVYPKISFSQAVDSAKVAHLTILNVFQSLYNPYCRISDTTYGFLEHLPPINDCSPPLRTSLQAAFMALTATHSRSKRLGVEAQILHNRALRHIIQATISPQIDTQQKIAATLVLGLCQCFSVVASGTATWAQHIGGALAIFKSNASSPVSEVVEQSLAINTAWKIIMTDTVDSQSQTLLDIRSLQLPSRDPASTITQILLHIPFLHQEVHNTRSQPKSYASNSASLIERHELLSASLEAWLITHFATKTPYTVTESISITSPKFASVPHDTFPTAYVFKDCVSAHLYWRYLLGQYLLARIADDATTVNVDPLMTANTESQPTPPNKLKGQQMWIDAICKCIMYICLPEHGFSGMVGAIMLLKIAREIYNKMQRMEEKYWCTAVLQCLAQQGLAAPP